MIAIPSAALGLAARVATSVAIEFAASWTPFVNASPSASAMAMTRPTSMLGAYEA